jgi:hypothetical protein
MVATAVLLAALVYPLLRWGGLPWAAAGVLISSAAVMIWQLTMAARLTGTRAVVILRALVGCLPGCGWFIAAWVASAVGPRSLTLLWIVAAACGYALMTLATLRSAQPGKRASISGGPTTT